jgi:diguanylate cyclase (GGDEF)-like protein
MRSPVLRRRRARSQRVPRLVLRFAVFTALGLAAAAGVILLVVRHGDTVQAERHAISRARFATEAVLKRDLRPADLRAPVQPGRRAELDTIFTRILLDGTLGATLYAPSGVVTYSTDHRLIGTRSNEPVLLRESLAGTVVSHVRSAQGSAPRALETFVPLVLGRDRVKGAVALDQDYRPIDAAADAAFFPIAAVLEVVLVLLFLVLVPVLARVSGRIRRHVEELEHVATHDELTDLPNRLGFRRATAAALVAASAEHPVAVLLVDFDGFRDVNDALGHASGDALLREASGRLCGQLASGAAAGRVGADEFAVVCTAVGTEARAAAERIRRALERPYVLDGVQVALDVRVGLALAPLHGTDEDGLLRRAAVAADIAKERRSGIEVYDPADDASDVVRVALAAELREAIHSGQLRLHYQPQLDVATGRLRGVEALVRWQHPDRGLLGPGEFVPVAERSGLVKELTRAVVEEATRQWHAWNEAGLDVDVAVNLTAVDLLDLSLPDDVAGTLHRYGMPAARLVLELTETTLMGDVTRTGEVLGRLHRLGVRLAIDDFGTGYSSLAYLKRLPVHEVKVDRGFVAGIPADEANVSIVRWTIELAHGLGLAVVAEGVETREQLEHLEALGCDVAQGYFLGRPMPGDELAVFATSRSGLTAAA